MKIKSGRVLNEIRKLSEYFQDMSPEEISYFALRRVSKNLRDAENLWNID